MECFGIGLFHSLIFLISLVGCLWQLTDMSNIYFSYETNVNVKFERETMVQIPGITICTNLSLTVNEDYMLDRYPQLRRVPNYEVSRPSRSLSKCLIVALLYQETKYFVLGKYLKNLTLYEQLNEATMDYRQMFNSCLIMKPIASQFENQTEDYIECDQISPIRQYVTYYRKCFFISSQLGSENSSLYQVDHDTTLRDNGFPLFQIKLNNRFLDEPVVFIHSRTTPFLGFIGGQTNGIHLNNIKYSSYTLSYVKTSSSLLPPPYKTMCRDYNSIGYKTLSHCIVSCKVDCLFLAVLYPTNRRTLLGQLLHHPLQWLAPGHSGDQRIQPERVLLEAGVEGEQDAGQNDGGRVSAEVQQTGGLQQRVLLDLGDRSVRAQCPQPQVRPPARHLHLPADQTEHALHSLTAAASDRVHLLLCQCVRPLVRFLHHRPVGDDDPSLPSLPGTYRGQGADDSGIISLFYIIRMDKMTYILKKIQIPVIRL